MKNGLHSLKRVYLKFFYDNSENEPEKNTVNLPSPRNDNTDNEALFFKQLMKDGATQQKNKEPEVYKIEVELEKEAFKLADILSQVDKFKDITNMKFWNHYMDQMPRLARLALVLLNINVSSAFIERFFSICGIICKKNSGNMKDDLIITRSMLKANMKILDDLCLN